MAIGGSIIMFMVTFCFAYARAVRHSMSPAAM